MANPVGGQIGIVEPAITVDTAIYAAGDVVGGKIELARVFRSKGGSAVLQDVFIKDVAEQDEAFEILLFNEDPEQTYTDQAACPTLAADIAKLVARVSIPAANYVSVGGLAMAFAGDLAHPIRAAKGLTSLWAVFVATGTPTYVAGTDLTVHFAFLQD